ncbi:MAG TPA: hypothetical protein VEE83_00300, partial [Thermoplasmata archaeon]|nr:hypothetical protein [Thermoplasmata archaeon]
DRFYEMKSYTAEPMPPDVTLQLRLFQCAFRTFQAYLACFDRHVTPVTSSIAPVPMLSETDRFDVLRRAYRTALEKGTEKVLEYIDNPVVRYTVPE